jgi:hypothetical protein
MKKTQQLEETLIILKMKINQKHSGAIMLAGRE